MTKAEEKILAHVREVNELGALAGLSTSPVSTNWDTPESRFVRRLHDAGKILWVHWTPKLGSGWVLPEYRARLT